MATQCRHGTVQQASSGSAEGAQSSAGGTLTLFKMHLGAVYNMPRHSAVLRETERETSPEKRTLLSPIRGRTA